MILKIRSSHGYPLTEMLGTEQVSYNLENELVRDYMARVSYTTSEIKNDVYTKMAPYMYANEETDFSSYGEIGNPVIVVGNGKNIVVTPASGSVSAAKTLSASAESGATRIYNLVPGVTYTWKLYNASNKVVDSGKFKTSGQVRMIKIAMQNFRDLGGWSCGSGKRVKYGRLYRGMGWLRKPNEAMLRSINASVDTDVVETLKWLGVTLDLDLRNNSSTGPDKAMNPNYPSSSGIRWQYCPLSSYRGVFKASDSYFAYTKSALEYIASELSKGGGVYIHCKTGADRTGTLCAIILALLGVSANDVTKDYDLTLLNGMKYLQAYMGGGAFGPFMTVLLNRPESTLKDKVYGWVTGTGTWKVGNTTYTELGVAPSVVNTLRTQLIDG